jgi:hypothetical protein
MDIFPITTALLRDWASLPMGDPYLEHYYLALSVLYHSSPIFSFQEGSYYNFSKRKYIPPIEGVYGRATNPIKRRAESAKAG